MRASLFQTNASTVVGVLVCDLAEFVVFVVSTFDPRSWPACVLVVGGGLFVGVVVSV